MNPITAANVLLVEGKDEKFLAELLLQMHDASFAEKVDIQNEGGGSKLLASAQAIDVVSGFNQLKRLAILVDAEEDRDATDAIWTKFRTDFLNQYPSRECDYLILPTNQSSGALESVFLQTLDTNTNPIAKCTTDFMTCVAGHDKQSTQAQKDKLALMTYINAEVKTPHSSLSVALLQRAKHLFDFKHEAFKPLTEFLQKLL